MIFESFNTEKVESHNDILISSCRLGYTNLRLFPMGSSVYQYLILLFSHSLLPVLQSLQHRHLLTMFLDAINPNAEYKMIRLPSPAAHTYLWYVRNIVFRESNGCCSLSAQETCIDMAIYKIHGSGQGPSKIKLKTKKKKGKMRSYFISVLQLDANDKKTKL